MSSMLEWLRTRQELPTDVSGLLGLAQCDFTLLPFQKQGLLSMIDLEEGLHKGGILADDMGMGKTVQLIALICSRPCDPSAMPSAPGGLRACGATLVVVPASLDLQWEGEIARLAPQLVVKRFVGTRADNCKPAPGATVPRRLQKAPSSVSGGSTPAHARPPAHRRPPRLPTWTSCAPPTSCSSRTKCCAPSTRA
jgi:SNF2 family DNA or RNA helicase